MLLSPAYLPKLAATIGLFTQYGLRDVAQRQGLLALLPADEQGAQKETEPQQGEGRDVRAQAHAFRTRLVELGPAYVKLGQILSARPDLLPPPYIEELEHLQDDVPPTAFEDISAVVEEELRARISVLFQSFDRDPLGSASLGQVHAAILRNGRPVVVKVQRPGIREQLVKDISFFQELARFLSAHTSTGHRLDLVGVVRQVERALAEELDYCAEARNMASFRRNMAEFPHLVIPRVIEAYTTSRVLTTERIHGRKIDDIPPVTRAEYDFCALAAELSRAYLRQITVDGHFHADPHPGNLFIILPDEHENPRTPAELAEANRRTGARDAATPLAAMEQDARKEASAHAVTPAARNEPKIALIDFGMTARLSESLRNQVVRLLVALSDNRGDEVAETLIALGQPQEDFDRIAYTHEVSGIVARNVDRTASDTATGRVLSELIQSGFRHDLILPAELTLLAKAVFNLDTVTRALDPTFNPAKAIRDYTLQIANHRAQQVFSPRQLIQVASEASALLRVLPHRIDTITELMASNQLALRLDTPQLPKQLEGMQKIANRIFTGLVLGGLLVASGLVMPYQRRLGMLGFMVAAVIGLYMVVTILVTDRRTGRREQH